MPQPEEYQAIEEWGKQLASTNGYIRWEQEKAAKMNAPLNAIYERDGVWRTTDQITNPYRLSMKKKYRRKDGMMNLVCEMQHDEFGPIPFEATENYTGLNGPCEWHNADESFDREAYLEANDMELLRCRRAETTRDCPLGHDWVGSRAYHRGSTEVVLPGVKVITADGTTTGDLMSDDSIRVEKGG